MLRLDRAVEELLLPSRQVAGDLVSPVVAPSALAGNVRAVALSGLLLGGGRWRFSVDFPHLGECLQGWRRLPECRLAVLTFPLAEGRDAIRFFWAVTKRNAEPRRSRS